MATNAQIRQALAARIAGAAVIPRVHSVFPGQISPPAVVVRRQQTTFDTTQDGQSDDRVFALVVFVQYAATEQAQEQLDAYISPSGANSIVAAVRADPTLGGVVDWAVVTEAGQDEVVTYNGADYLSSTLTVVTG